MNTSPRPLALFIQSLRCSTLLCLLLLTIPVVFPSIGFAENLIEVHVKKGSNLIHIARDYCTNRSAWKEIARINNLKSPYIIKENGSLLIPYNILLTEGLTAQVAYVSGIVNVVDQDGQHRPLSVGDELFTGQSVNTGADGYAQLIFPENKFTRIEPDSKLTITYLFRLLDGVIKAELYLDKGRIVHKVTQKLKEKDTFKTRTAISITGIRGTEYRMKMADEETNIVETLRGLVQVESDGGNRIVLEKGEGSKVKKGEEPEPPKALPKPPEPPRLEEFYRTLPISIKTPALAHVKAIRLRVTRDHAGQHAVVEQQVSPGDELYVMALADGIYYGFFTIINDEGFESSAAPPAPFEVRTIPGAPVISAPQNGHTSWDGKIEIRWLRSDQAVSYQLELAADPSFTEIIGNNKVTEPTYLTPQLETGSYFFRVKAVAEDGFESNYSQPLSFKKMAEPTMGSIEGSVSEGIHLQWPVIMDGCTYDLQIAKDLKFTSLFLSKKGLTENTFALNEYISHGTYYVRIRATLDNGLQSQWTPPQKLYIAPEPLGWQHAVMGAGVLVLILL